MVSSGTAWNIIRDSIQDTWVDDKVDVQPVLSDDLKKLCELRQASKTLQEKLAISMYMQQVRTFLDNITQYGIVCHNKVIFTPIIYSFDDLRSMDIDGWVKDLKCDGLNELLKSVRLSGVNGEDDYIRGLMELLKGRYGKAKKYFYDAYVKGYAKEEISEIKSKWLIE